MRGQLSIEARQRATITRLINENKRLRDRIQMLERERKEDKAVIETLVLQVKELQKIIFGRKHDGNKDNDSTSKQPRGKSSYRHSIPDPCEITKEEKYSIDTCPDCGSFLVWKTTIIRYLIDILLPMVNEQTGLIEAPAKTVVKQTIEKGWCPKCKHWYIAKLLDHSPPAKNNEVLYGSGIREFVAFETNIIKNTYSQIQDELIGLYNINISQGEIAKVLEKTGTKLSPEYERLKERVKKSKGCHLDETGWQTRGEKNYVHINAPTDSDEVVFLIGRNRGKGNSSELIGDNYDGVVISDFLANYKNLSGEHQGCWAHLLRRTRDLKNNSSLSEDKRDFVMLIHTQLQAVFNNLKLILVEPFDLKKRQGYLPKLYQQIKSIAEKIHNFKESPKKLNDVANLMLEYKHELFTCITHEGIPPENNKAEQGLRHLVLKRKNSFGTQSEKGNKTLEINLSVLLSLWRQDKTTFWPRFRELIE
jgi:hypothetical protein